MGDASMIGDVSCDDGVRYLLLFLVFQSHFFLLLLFLCPIQPQRLERFRETNVEASPSVNTEQRSSGHVILRLDSTGFQHIVGVKVVLRGTIPGQCKRINIKPALVVYEKSGQEKANKNTHTKSICERALVAYHLKQHSRSFMVYWEWILVVLGGRSSLEPPLWFDLFTLASFSLAVGS